MSGTGHSLCADCWADWSAWLDPENLRKIGRAMGHVNNLGGAKVGGSTADPQTPGTTTTGLHYGFTPRGVLDQSRSNANDLSALVRSSQQSVRDLCQHSHVSGAGTDVDGWMALALRRRSERVWDQFLNG